MAHSTADINNRGEILFSEHDSRQFVAPDGTSLQPTSHSLTRVSASGQKLFTYQNPWYFRPVLFRLPGILAFVAAVALILIRNAKRAR